MNNANKKQTDIQELKEKLSANTISLFPGIDLTYDKLSTSMLAIALKKMNHIICIHYCKAGQMTWDIGGQKPMNLNPGDFSIHCIKSLSQSMITFPTEHYEGLTLWIDLDSLTQTPPIFLNDANLSVSFFYEKFCKKQSFTCLPKCMDSESIFSAFYDQPDSLSYAYQKLKTVELFFYLSKIDTDALHPLSEYKSEHIEIIKQIHEQLTYDMGKRFTIKELSKQYLINPTTLKAVFKSVYGTSLAAHVKEHRMRQAAKLLRETDTSIAEIAQSVGYDSQSKFAIAFKSYYQVLPKEYRKNNK